MIKKLIKKIYLYKKKKEQKKREKNMEKATEAWMHGKVIQFRRPWYLEDKWRDVDAKPWDAELYDWRVKPESK